MCEYLTQIVHFHDRNRDVFGDRFRAMLQAIDSKREQRMLPAALYHYDDSGRPVNGIPGIRFGGGRGCARIHAVGNDAVELLGDYGHRVTRLLGEDAGKPLRDTRYTGQVKAADSGSRLRSYRIGTMVFFRSNKKKDRGGLTTDKRALFDALASNEDGIKPRIAELLETRIRSGIEEQANAFMIDLPDDFLIGEIGFNRTVITTSKKRNPLLAATKVTFQTNLDLHGPWHVGYLRARGFGEIRAVR